VKFRNEVEVADDAFLAAYVLYLGYPVMKCLTNSGSTVWAFLVPSCDMDIMREEFESDQPIQVKSYATALKKVYAFVPLSRKNGGEYITTEWREVIGI
jgi:hypothetical protein